MSLNVYTCDAGLLASEIQLKALGNGFIQGKLKPPKKEYSGWKTAHSNMKCA